MKLKFEYIQANFQGLAYLHDSSPLKFHGNLKSSKCLLDNQFGLKLSDYANTRLAQLNMPRASRRRSSIKIDTQQNPEYFCWTAPEVLRGALPDQSSDIYSFSIVCFQILSARVEPFDDLDFSYKGISSRVLKNSNFVTIYVLKER